MGLILTNQCVNYIILELLTTMKIIIFQQKKNRIYSGRALTVREGTDNSEECECTDQMVWRRGHARSL